MPSDKKDPRGQEDLIHRLFVEEYAAMRTCAYCALGDWGLAETAVQETFVVALRFREKLTACEKPAGWLYKALRYTIKHIERDRNLLLMRTVPLDELHRQEPARQDEHSLLDEELKADGDLQLLAKVYCGGYSIREVAQELGISVGACKMRLRRAKDRLRKKLE